MAELVGEASSSAQTKEERDSAAEILVQWNNTATYSYQIEFWPYIQSNQTDSCVNIVMENSPNNLMKLLGGTRLKFYKGLIIFTLAVFVNY